MPILKNREVWQRPRKQQLFELSPAEQANVKRALHAIKVRFGGWRQLAQRLGCRTDTVSKAAARGSGKNFRPSVGLALRASQLAGVPLEDVLRGAWPADGACPTCGRRG